MSESLAYNDETPMLAFLSDLDSEVEFYMPIKCKGAWRQTVLEFAGCIR